MTCKLRSDGEIDEGDSKLFRMFRIPPFGHVEKGAPFASHIPNQPANSVRHASVLVLCSCRRHDCYIAISLRWKLGLATSAEAVESITKNLMMLVSRSEVTRNTNSRHSFGDGIRPRKHRQTDR
jgi:hypothetical protein